MIRLMVLAAALATGPAIARQSPGGEMSCANVRVALPPELSAWSDQQPVSAGVKPGDGATIRLGQAALVALHPARHLALAPATASTKPGDANGGTLALAITQAGTYRVALGGGAWIDLVQDGKAIASTSHGHGPMCSGVRKMVDFKLAPGNYTIQLSRSNDAKIAMLVVKLA